MALDLNEELFDELLSKFKQIYSDRSLVRGYYTKKVKIILENGLKAGLFRSIPIASRIKTLDSAIDSIRNRQEGRMKRQILKDRLEAQGKNWLKYWKKRDKDYRIDDVGPFEDCETMFSSLHDIGGVRVCVYFPNDVEKVVSFLHGHDQIEVVRVVSRGQGTAPDMVELRNYVEELEEHKLRGDSADDPRVIKPIKSMFSGYRATHVHVKLIGDGIRKSDENLSRENLVEVQIATVVMHAWSQIEHDIVYKPGAGAPSDEERLILDTFNGIVMAGESNLRQLAELTERKENSRAQAADSPATGFYELGVWLTAYCQEHKVFFLGRNVGWNKLILVFEILEAANEHTSGKFHDLFKLLLNEKGSKRRFFNQNLPLFLLRQRYKQEEQKVRDSIEIMYKGVERKQITAVSARLCAMRVIHSLDMASYLGIEEFFLKNIENILPEMEKRPSLIDFLDLVHPTNPRLNQAAEDSIIEFCEAFLNREQLHEFVHNDLDLVLMELPTMLTDIGRVVCHRDDTRSSHSGWIITVPTSLSTLLHDPEHTNWLPDIFIAATDMSSDGQRFVTGLPQSFAATANMIWEKAGQQKNGLFRSIKDKEYFKPTESINSLPMWEILSGSMEWQVITRDIFNGKVNCNIEKFRRDCSLLDFGSRLMPERNFSIESEAIDGPKTYTFRTGRQLFRLTSGPDEFKLCMIIEELSEDLDWETGDAERDQQ